jgi:hypothetical protein
VEIRIGDKLIERSRIGSWREVRLIERCVR